MKAIMTTKTSLTHGPVIRTISFKTDASLTQHAVRKNDHADVKCDFTYIHYQADSNNQVFSRFERR